MTRFLFLESQPWQSWSHDPHTRGQGSWARVANVSMFYMRLYLSTLQYAKLDISITDQAPVWSVRRENTSPRILTTKAAHPVEPQQLIPQYLMEQHHSSTAVSIVNISQRIVQDIGLCGSNKSLLSWRCVEFVLCNALFFPLQFASPDMAEPALMIPVQSVWRVSTGRTRVTDRVSPVTQPQKQQMALEAPRVMTVVRLNLSIRI